MVAKPASNCLPLGNRGTTTPVRCAIPCLIHIGFCPFSGGCMFVRFGLFSTGAGRGGRCSLGAGCGKCAGEGGIPAGRTAVVSMFIRVRFVIPDAWPVGIGLPYAGAPGCSPLTPVSKADWVWLALTRSGGRAWVSDSCLAAASARPPETETGCESKICRAGTLSIVTRGRMR
jgi:hypothetical protein